MSHNYIPIIVLLHRPPPLRSTMLPPLLLLRWMFLLLLLLLFLLHFLLPLFLPLSFLLGLLPPPLPLFHRIVLPHEKAVPLIQFPRPSCQVGSVIVQPSQPAARHFLSSRAGLGPHLVEISSTAVILGDADGVRYVENGVPPPVGDEDGFSGVLGEFVAFEVGIIRIVIVVVIAMLMLMIAMMIAAAPPMRRMIAMLVITIRIQSRGRGCRPSFHPRQYGRKVMNCLVILPGQN
mmetsp:Transcript_11297/g.24095  ORF Transcript_11297/g.24095 Transcript_11297/m.24095 type:complete len:234 (+) Transcript_11297:294-995(+)